MTDFSARRMISTLLTLLIVASLAWAAPAAPAAKDDDPMANDPVEQAIRKAVAYLYKTQKGDNWEQAPRRDADAKAHEVTGVQYGGLTAMAVYGLLAAGESPQKPELARAIAWLDKTEFIGTYAMGMKLQIWNYIEHMTPAQKQILKKDATLLLGGVKLGANDAGLYHYWVDPTKGGFDHSCSNYGVLGMWAAAQQNLEVPTKYWELVDAAWRKGQQKDGGWAYTRTVDDKHKTTMNLTPAGVATLFITQDMLSAGRGGECKGNIVDKDIERGIAWMEKNFASVGMSLYGLYNVERVGTASGYKYFGTVDWYKDGSTKLVKAQGADGAWAGGHGGNIPGTVWGILFLVKGRAPVMMNKLDYAIDLRGDKGVTNWNQRPRDLANLSRWAGKQLEKELNWQIVNLKVDIEDLHDSPILYISGNQNIALAQEHKDKLKQFVEGGGMILGHADCNASIFSTAFQKLGQELFPAGEFRDLPDDHLIYNVHFKRQTWGAAAATMKLRGLSNGARELMVLIPNGDPARYWQIQNFSSAQTKPLAELATNIYLYAVDKDALRSKFKGQSYIVKRTNKAPGQALKVARLEYSGNWNPEPGGWRRFDNLMANTRGIDVTPINVKLGEGKLKASEFKLAHLTGTVKFKLSDGQRKEIQDFVNAGGTLLVDAAGGASDFKDSAEAELEALFPNAGRAIQQTLPLEHPLYSAGGDKVSRVAYRTYAKRTLVSGLNVPRLRGIEVNNRTAVIYSPEDLSVGLVGMTIDGVYGYTPEWSSKLMEKVVLFSMGASAPKVATQANATDKAVPAAAKEVKKEEPKKEEPKKPEEKKPTAPAANAK